MASPDRVQGPHFPPLPAAQPSSLFNLSFDDLQSQLAAASSSKPLNAVSLDDLLKNLSSNGDFEQQSADSSLEDFLARAGLVNQQQQEAMVSPQSLMAIDPEVAAEWLQFQMQQQKAMDSSDLRRFRSSGGGLEDGSIGFNCSENPLPHAIPMAATSSDSQASAEKKIRVSASEEMMEKTIQRRQKRMIKNRESAARSRARKQAYTNQLEHAVMQLKSTNSWLKKQKEVESFLSSNGAPLPRYQLRRTTSASF